MSASRFLTKSSHNSVNTQPQKMKFTEAVVVLGRAVLFRTCDQSILIKLAECHRQAVETVLLTTPIWELLPAHFFSVNVKTLKKLAKMAERKNIRPALLTVGSIVIEDQGVVAFVNATDRLNPDSENGTIQSFVISSAEILIHYNSAPAGLLSISADSACSLPEIKVTISDRHSNLTLSFSRLLKDSILTKIHH